MKFNEFESIMNSKGVTSLAEVARQLKTSPQAVSNWKARDQIPHHVVLSIQKQEIKVEKYYDKDDVKIDYKPDIKSIKKAGLNKDALSLSEIFFILLNQSKILIVSPIISVFGIYICSDDSKTFIR